MFLGDKRSMAVNPEDVEGGAINLNSFLKCIA